MDRKALARKIRDAIFERADQDGRVMHGDSLDTVIEQILAANLILPAPEQVDFTAYPWGMVVETQSSKLSA